MQKSDAFTLLSNVGDPASSLPTPCLPHLIAPPSVVSLSMICDVLQISEDCLYLNVFTPFPVPTEPLPVMLFFYGGSWKEGSASFFLYNADQLITTLEDVIVVTANYRLQAFGFLASESLRQEDADGSCGNYGLQVCVLCRVSASVCGLCCSVEVRVHVGVHMDACVCVHACWLSIIRWRRAGCAGPAHGDAVAAEERRGVWRRSYARHDLRRERWRWQRVEPPAVAAVEGSLPPRHRGVRPHRSVDRAVVQHFRREVQGVSCWR
jgi:hypothetical protein